MLKTHRERTSEEKNEKIAFWALKIIGPRPLGPGAPPGIR